VNVVQKNDRPNAINALENDETGWKCRVVVTLILAMLLVGPTPGAVGSCNQNEDDNPVLDMGDEMIDYCQEKEELTCFRQGERGELDKEKGEVDACRKAVRRICETRTWQPDCRPTKRQAEACINALRSMDTLDTEESKIKECSEDALCNVEYEKPESSDSDAGDKS